MSTPDPEPLLRDDERSRETETERGRGMSETLEDVLAAHVEVGGTHWDRQRRTTFRECQCGAWCYMLE